MKLRTAALAAVLLLAQQQTPTQLIDQLQALLEQLRAALSSSTPPPAVTVTNAAGLAAALKVGGAITVAPGTYAGNFTITKPTTLAGAGATLTAADLLAPTLTVAADDVIVRGLRVQLGNPDRDAIVVGRHDATSADLNPHRVRFEAVEVLPSAKGGGHRGFALHGSNITLQGVTVLGFYEKGRDSQAVWISNGPGPYTVIDSVLEASGENILVGGATPGIVGMNPADITIRGNTLRKPDSFRALGTVKNSFELKTGIRVVFEGNTIDGNWIDGQAGSPIVITVRGQGDCGWCTVDDVTIRGNTVRRAPDGFAVNVLGRDDGGPSGQLRRLTIERNLFAESPNGIQVINGVADALVVTNNTLPRIAGRFLSFSSSPASAKLITPITFARNVLRSGDYGITGDGSTAVGLASLTANAAIVDFSGNVIEMTDQRTITLPPGNRILKFGTLAALLNPTTLKLLDGTAGY